MSFFYITNSTEKLNESKKYCNEFLFETKQIDFSNNYSILLKKNSKSKEFTNPLVLENKEKLFIGLGTFFNDKGYFDKCINLENDINFDNIYGHFVFITFNKKNSSINIITDKVGLINVFHTNENCNFHISSDPFLLALSLDSFKLSETGINEYLLNESCLGDETIIAKVQRLKLGHTLRLNKNGIEETLFYEYKIDKLTKEEYKERIDNYFSMVSKFKGKVGVEISAGFDTKLVLSCFNKTVKKFIGITNDNTADNGVDVYTSKLIAEKLKFKLKVVSRQGLKKAQTLKMSHYFTLSRNIIRSSFMPAINKEKYKYCDLLIGGYGGEVLRSKYCKYSSINKFLLGYYKLEHLPKNNLGVNLFNLIFKKMKINYPQENMLNGTYHVSNWLYTMDRMRIWGGGETYGKHIDGLRLHPFMDWYLLAPVFGFSDSELKNDKLVKEIIQENSNEIYEIPVNTLHPFLVKNAGSLIYKPAFIFFKGINLLHRLVNKLVLITGLNNKKNISENDFKNLMNHCKNNDITLIDYSVKDFDTKLESLNRIYNTLQNSRTNE